MFLGTQSTHFATVIDKNTPTKIFTQFLAIPQEGEQRLVQIQESMGMGARKSYFMQNHPVGVNNLLRYKSCPFAI